MPHMRLTSPACSSSGLFTFSAGKRYSRIIAD
jgi:hypothetical protein